MALVSTYDPSSQAGCPTCGQLVNCDNIGGITFGSDPYLDFFHHKCGTKWRYHIHTGQVECPIPLPICGYCGKGHTGMCEEHKLSNNLLRNPAWVDEAYAKLGAVRDRLEPSQVKVIQEFLEME